VQRHTTRHDCDLFLLFAELEERNTPYAVVLYPTLPRQHWSRKEAQNLVKRVFPYNVRGRVRADDFSGTDNTWYRSGYVHFAVTSHEVDAPSVTRITIGYRSDAPGIRSKVNREQRNRKLYGLPFGRHETGRRGKFAVVEAEAGGAADVGEVAVLAVVAGCGFNTRIADAAGGVAGGDGGALDDLGVLLAIERRDGSAVVVRQNGREGAQIDVFGAEEAWATGLGCGVVAGGGGMIAEQLLQREQAEWKLQTGSALDIGEIRRGLQPISQKEGALPGRIEIDPVERTADANRSAVHIGEQQWIGR
jgi:hypothetical protein